MIWMLLDYAIDVHGPDVLMGILKVTVSGSKLWSGRGLGGSGGFLDDTGSVDQIAVLLEGYRAVA